MTPQQILDILERLHRAAGHPDHADIYRYGSKEPQGLAVTFGSGAKAFLWAAEPPVRSSPADFPETMPDYRTRAMHALRLAVDLLERARPEGIDAWRTVSVVGTHLTPCGLEIRSGGDTVVLQATAGGGTVKEPDDDPYADWTIPASVSV